MPKTLFVGCDVSAKHDTVCLMNEERNKIGYQTFPSTLSSEKDLESWLLKLMNEKGVSTLKMPTEETFYNLSDNLETIIFLMNVIQALKQPVR